MAKLTDKNRFSLLYPDIAKQWHPTKNGDLRPEDFSYGSEKKVWWKCSKGDDHEWDVTINNRTQGQGCPFCAGRRAGKDNNLLFLFPDIAKLWHPTKNRDLRPEDFTPGSHKKVWWKCPKGDDHEWDAMISSRTRGTGCPVCAGRKVGKDNNLLFLFPDIAKLWHPTKNGKLKPEDVTKGSHKKVWWKCPKGDDHEWDAVIKHRTNGTGCPVCAGRKPVN